MMITNTQRHFDNRASNYELTDWVSDSSLEIKISEVINKINPKTFLDLGIGTGIIEQHIFKTIEISEIDISPKMLDICQKRLPAAKLVCGSFSNLCKLFENQRYDVIFARASLGHLLISPVLEQAKLLLSPQGKIVLCESIAYNENDCDTQVDFHNLIHPGHVEFPTVEQFLNKFTDLKMEVLQYEIIYTLNNTESLFRSLNTSKEKEHQIENFLLKLNNRMDNPWKVNKFDTKITYRRPWLLVVCQTNV